MMDPYIMYPSTVVLKFICMGRVYVVGLKFGLAKTNYICYSNAFLRTSSWPFSGSKVSTIAIVLLLIYSQFSHLAELSHKDIQFVYIATGTFQNRLFHCCSCIYVTCRIEWKMVFRNYDIHNWSRIDGDKWYRGIMWCARDCVQVCVLCMCFVCVLQSRKRVSTLERALTPYFMFSPSFESPMFYCKFYLSVLLVYYFLFLIASELTVSAKGSVLMYLVSWWSILCCWILAFSI